MKYEFEIWLRDSLTDDELLVKNNTMNNNRIKYNPSVKRLNGNYLKMFNSFKREVNDKFYLVDAPGYGYASRGYGERQDYGKYIEELANVPVVVDSHLAKNETELDWLVTWQGKGKPKIKGVGKALVAEFFSTIKKDKFRDVFVRSEVPENSYAMDFYESLGFEQIGKKRLKLFNKNSAQYSINDYTETDDDTIPMIATRKTIEYMAKELSKTMTRQEFKKASLNAEELIKI